MTWMTDAFGTDRPIIAMCHLRAMPGDPGYDAAGGLDAVLEHARSDLDALQGGRVDAVLFSNEFSLPYLTRVETVTVAAMARIIGELRAGIRVPFGVNVLWDPRASIDLAVATGAGFVREIFTGAYASDFGVWDTACGEVVRHRRAIDGGHVRLLFNIVPEAAAYLAPRDLADIARSTVFNARPDALCVSGLTAGASAPLDALRRVKAAVPGTIVLANTGVRIENLEAQLEVADGAIVGSTFKVDGNTWNPVDPDRVAAFMDRVRAFRASTAVPVGAQG